MFSGTIASEMEADVQSVLAEPRNSVWLSLNVSSYLMINLFNDDFFIQSSSSAIIHVRGENPTKPRA